MLRRDFKPVVGQNLRYIGRPFPGFVKGQPYMTFVQTHEENRYLVRYNEKNIVVHKFDTEPVV